MKQPPHFVRCKDRQFRELLAVATVGFQWHVDQPRLYFKLHDGSVPKCTMEIPLDVLGVTTSISQLCHRYQGWIPEAVFNGRSCVALCLRHKAGLSAQRCRHRHRAGIDLYSGADMRHRAGIL